MKTSAFLVLSLAAAAVAGETDWPTWRGPHRNGTAPGATPPLQWSESEHVQWKYEIPGLGTSSPIVWADSVYITTAIGTGKKPAGSIPAPDPALPGAPPPARGAAADSGTAGNFVQNPPADPPSPPQGERPRGRRGGGGFGRGTA